MKQIGDVDKLEGRLNPYSNKIAIIKYLLRFSNPNVFPLVINGLGAKS
jgi:LEA14-like dessication related protein